MDSGKPESIESLYHELLKWFYGIRNESKALSVAAKLEKLISADPKGAGSIRREEIRSLIAELKDDLTEATQSREAEIRKILELHAQTANTADWEYVSRQYDHSDVGDRLDLLAILYDKQGHIERAIAVLLESKNYCESHRIPFDGQELLDELELARKDEPEPRAVVPREDLDEAIRREYATFGTPADEIVVVDRRSRQFAATVNKRLASGRPVTIQQVKRRLLILRKRSAARGGLPRQNG